MEKKIDNNATIKVFQNQLNVMVDILEVRVGSITGKEKEVKSILHNLINLRSMQYTILDYFKS